MRVAKNAGGDSLKIVSRLVVLSALACGRLASAEGPAEIAQELLTLEHRAMDGWLKGDPDPMLALCDPGITYVHVMTAKRLNGVAEVKALFEPYSGKPLFDRYEILDPQVQVTTNTAVLTYEFVRHNGTVESHWNATQVYQRKKEGWRVIHTHWSMIRPQ